MCNCNCNCDAKSEAKNDRQPEPESIPCLTCDCVTAADCVYEEPGQAREPEDPYGWDPRSDEEPCDGSCDACVNAGNREFLTNLTDLALDTFIRLLDSDNDVVAALAAERVREFAVELGAAIA